MNRFVVALFAGPIAAYVGTSLGCIGDDPLFGVLCGHNVYVPLVAFTLLVWVAIGVTHRIRSSRRSKP
jgi:hypothetical protein